MRKGIVYFILLTLVGLLIGYSIARLTYKAPGRTLMPIWGLQRGG